MNVADAVFGKLGVTVWKSGLTRGRGVARIPIQHEILVWHSGQRARGLSASCRVAFVFIFEEKDDVLLRSLIGKLAQFGIHRVAVRFIVFELPEIEHADL